ncbi:MAG: hypothetical protein ACI9MR_003519, partial [Myxococcota bacterium]
SLDVVLETPLSPRSPMPCGGACAFGEVCVRPQGAGLAERCGATLTFDGGCAGCDAESKVCASLDGGPAQCLARIRPAYAAELPAEGAGQFVSCAPRGDAVIAAWLDPQLGSLVVAQSPFGTTQRWTVDGAPTASVGAHAVIAVSGAGRIGVAYADVTNGSVRFAEAPNPAGPWTTTEVHRIPGRELGAWAGLMWLPDETPAIVYGDAVQTDVWLARREPGGCWAREPVFGDGPFTFGGIALGVEPNTLDVSALRYGFDAVLRPTHRPVLRRVAVPTCAGQ